MSGEGSDQERTAGYSRTTIANSLVASRLSRTVRVARRWVHRSWTCDLLTTSPEPTILTVDLERTWTAGSVLALLDRLSTATGPGWQASRTRTVASRVKSMIRRLLEALEES
jgi:hypothetical protein